jgi:acetoin utilization deacetylase AcuC-like enzyme
MAMQVGLIQLVQEQKHPAPPGHPENAHRMRFALEYLIASDIASGLKEIRPAAIDPEEIVCKVHSPDYIDFLRTAAEDGETYLDSDTYLSRTSFAAALETAAAAMDAVGLLLSDEFKRIFLAARPPGHHAEYYRGMGFCLINNTAVAAETALTNHNLKRVAIVDWDVHHGNGTQHYFYERNDAYYVSLHRFPFYPGSGASAERGEGAGEGYTLNFPFPQGTGNDRYIRTFKEQIIPEMEKYRPELIIITAGFDAHRDDPLGGMQVTEEGFGEMSQQIVDFANKCCNGRILSIFEGGYSPSGNAVSVYHHLKELQKD